MPRRHRNRTDNDRTYSGRTYPRTFTRGRLGLWWLAFLASALVLGALIGLLLWNPGRPASQTTQEPLIVYCAAGLKQPVEAVARVYQQAYGVPIQLQYGGSQTLLTNLEVSKKGDLYLPADDSYLQMAHARNLTTETISLARMTPVLAVKRGNPKNIHSLNDLLHADIRLAQADPDAAAIGKVTRALFQQTGQWNALKQHTTVFKPTVNEVANDIKIGAVDAGLLWDALLSQYPDLEGVKLLELQGAVANVRVAVLKSSGHPAAALRFARYLGARDKGLPIFKQAGFDVVEGDLWAETPELHRVSGSMRRPAVEQAITTFEQREGVRVLRVYNGCIPCALAVQPLAVGRQSNHRQLTIRLLDTIKSPLSRERFLSEGFRWKAID